jgi:phospholipase/lecithinase/hemolysin
MNRSLEFRSPRTLVRLACARRSNPLVGIPIHSKTEDIVKRVVQLLLLCAIATAIGPIGLSADTAEEQPSGFIVFGDSLSDTGNVWHLTGRLIPPSISPHRTYFDGRFSNGPVAIEYFWDALDRDADSVVRPFLADPTIDPGEAVNFAFGGATSGQWNAVTPQLTVPGLLQQVEMFAAVSVESWNRDALFVVFVGANDYLMAPPTSPANPLQVVSNIKFAVERLHALGARNIVVMNLPDLSLTPIVPPDARPFLTTQVLLHNYLLRVALKALDTRLTGANIIEMDVFKIVNSLQKRFDMTTPAATPAPAATCLLTNPMDCPDANFDVHDRYFFWDVQHPTTFAHETLGRRFYEKLVED